MKNITISVDEEMWARIREVAATEHKSVNAFIKETVARSLPGAAMTAGERAAQIARQIGPAPKSWTWSRSEIYEEMNSENPTDVR